MLQVDHQKRYGGIQFLYVESTRMGPRRIIHIEDQGSLDVSEPEPPPRPSTDRPTDYRPADLHRPIVVFMNMILLAQKT